MTTDGPGATCPGGQQDPAARLDALVWLDPASDRDVALWRDIRLEMLTVAPEAFGSTLPRAVRGEPLFNADPLAQAVAELSEQSDVLAVVGPIFSDEAVAAAKVTAHDLRGVDYTTAQGHTGTLYLSDKQRDQGQAILTFDDGVHARSVVWVVVPGEPAAAAGDPHRPARRRRGARRPAGR